MPNPTCPSREKLREYSVGRLSEEQSDDLASHLESCADCQATIMALGDAEDTLVGRLRMPLSSDCCLAEPQLQAAVAKAQQMLGPGPIPPEASGSEGRPASGMPPALGEYQLLAELGRGGMGRVYKARHTKLDRVVAVKVLPRGRLGDSQAISRFEREMRAVGRLAHANIVQAHDAREIDGTPVLIMEFVDGLDLAEIVRRLGPLPLPEACQLIRQTAAALQCAHEHGLVHRDIKPSNIMVTRSGEVKLLDLGLARFYAETPAGEEMTGSGQAMGTADYMAPEQAADSHTVDIRADIYSLGCTLYKLLSGRAPFSGPQYHGTLEKMHAHVHQPPPPIRQLSANVPEELAAVVDRMLAKNPDDRFATPAEVAAVLEPFCDGGNLADLVGRAVESPLSPWEMVAAGPLSLRERVRVRAEQVKGASDALPQPAPAAIRRWPILICIAVGLAFLGAMAAAFAAGVLITIKKNGQTYQVEAPPGSRTTVDENGNPTVELSGKAERRESSSEPGETSAPKAKAGKPAPGAISLAEAIRVFNARAADNPVGKKQPPLSQDEVIAAIRWSLLNPDKLPVSDKTLETLKKITDSRELPQGFQLEVLTGFEPNGRSEFTKWSVRLRIPAEPRGTTCVGIREVMINSRLIGEEERKVIAKQHKKWQAQGGIPFSEDAQYVAERAKAAEVDRSKQKSDKQPEEEKPKSGEAAFPEAKAGKPEVAKTPAVNPSAELNALQGQWKVVGVEKGKLSTRVDVDPETVLHMTIDGDRLMIFYLNKSGFGWYYNYRIDPTAGPKTIDLLKRTLQTNKRVASESLVFAGIYEIEGDRLKICLAHYEPTLKSEQRPKQFAIEPSSADALLVFERYRPADDEKTLQGRWAVVTEMDDGKVVAEKNERGRWFVFGDEHFGIMEGDAELARQKSKSVGGGAYVLDPLKQPKAITLYIDHVSVRAGRESFGPSRDKCLGIYKFDGDRLTIAYRKDGPQPEQFQSLPGSGITLLVLQKKMEPEAAPGVDSAAPAVEDF
jgi:uncharacterized protein (TIGR03067 family)